jgi:hypothetical protein
MNHTGKNKGDSAVRYPNLGIDSHPTRVEEVMLNKVKVYSPGDVAELCMRFVEHSSDPVTTIAKLQSLLREFRPMPRTANSDVTDVLAKMERR